MGNYTLVIDISTAEARMHLLDSSLRILCSNGEPLDFIRSNNPEVLEIDSTTLELKLVRLMKKILSQSANMVSDVVVTSQREGCVFLDDKDNIICVSPNIDYRASEVSYLLPNDIKNTIYNVTGHWPDGLFPAMKLLWFRKYRPCVFRKISRFMSINEWVVYKLLGWQQRRSKIDSTSAAESLLFDVRKLMWSEEIMEILRLKHLILPEIVSPGTVVGTVHPTLANHVGLSKHVRIRLAMADTQSALLGCGVLGTGDVGIVNGSTTPVQLVVDKPIVDKMARTWTCPYTPGLWVVESNCTKTGVIFKKLKEDLQCFLEELGREGVIGEKQLDKFILESWRETHEMITYFGPKIFDVSKGIQDFPAVMMFHEENTNIFKAVFGGYIENLAFAIRANIEQLQEITDLSPKRIILTGRASKSELLRKLLPIVLHDYERELYISQELNSTVIGAAMLAGNKIGESMVPVPLRSSSNKIKELCDYYSRKYLLWKKGHEGISSLSFLKDLEEMKRDADNEKGACDC